MLVLQIGSLLHAMGNLQMRIAMTIQQQTSIAQDSTKDQFLLFLAKIRQSQAVDKARMIHATQRLVVIYPFTLDTTVNIPSCLHCGPRPQYLCSADDTRKKAPKVTTGPRTIFRLPRAHVSASYYNKTLPARLANQGRWRKSTGITGPRTIFRSQDAIVINDERSLTGMTCDSLHIPIIT